MIQSTAYVAFYFFINASNGLLSSAGRNYTDHTPDNRSDIPNRSRTSCSVKSVKLATATESGIMEEFVYSSFHDFSVAAHTEIVAQNSV